MHLLPIATLVDPSSDCALSLAHCSRDPDTVDLAWPLTLPSPRAVAPENVNGAGRGIKGEGPCFFHTLRKFLHRVRMSVLNGASRRSAPSCPTAPRNVHSAQPRCNSRTRVAGVVARVL